jgi:hypothetical protein
MPLAYISAPYTSKAIKRKGRPYGEIKDREYIRFLEEIANVLREFGFTTILPHKHIYEWGGSDYAPEKVIRRAFESLSSCSLLVAYPEKSMGVNVLIGWASLLKKKIIILLNENEEVSIVHEGLKALTDTKIIKFKNIIDLKNKLREELGKFMSL